MIFFINEKQGKLELISFIFIIIAELSIFLVIPISKSKEDNKDKIFKISSYILLFVYLASSVFVSIYFLLGFGTSIKALVTWQIIIIAVAYIALSVIDLVAKSVVKSSKESLLAAENIRNIIDKSQILSEKYKKSEYNKVLSNLFETINYADFSVKVSTDDIIAAKIEELESALAEDSKDNIVNGLIEEILSLIKQRQTEVKALKSVQE